MNEGDPAQTSEPRGWGDPERQAACLAALAASLSEIRVNTLAKLGLGPGMSVLDAGSGVGELAIDLVSLAQPGGRIVGVDLNPDAVERARAAAVTAGVEVDFGLGDIRDLPFASDEFDAVRSERVFQYLNGSDAPRAAAGGFPRSCLRERTPMPARQPGAAARHGTAQASEIMRAFRGRKRDEP
jgi:SAM-dependent methyltransferase